MKSLLIVFLALISCSAFAENENTEIGVGSSSQLTFTLPTAFSGNLSLDLSQAVSNSKSYQLGALTTFHLSSTSSTLKLAATATIHFTDSDWKNAWFLRPLLGWERDTYGSIPISGIIYGIQVGKRFAITDQLIYRPVIEFSRNSYNNAQIVITAIGLSYFISAPQLF